MTTLPRGRQFTAADLAAMPDDGNRYELVDGALIVTPSPVTRHQIVVANLHWVLRVAGPSDLRVLFAPYDVKLSDITVLQPDLLVAPRTAFGEANLPGAPLLAVEVLSPSTRHIDLGLKRSAYEAARCPAYWVVDPEDPSVTAWELRGGEYVVAGTATGAETLTLAAPYPVSITPERLLD
ncbi:Uma2 family endonuclease [Nocardioides soli]|uniref:Uma2 family endonuclease n=1 Tax=Nocardioides soli TaxID=1036020 RepID=A0A7W4VSC4_9ACTN|nr:Uma2 family endonuclease [Nocardioides soli]MBB3040900.1 Uma2 family endonuclease [Nocardioides soli]